MLIVALVLALIGLVSLVTAVVTSNELIAWVCIAASVLGVILLIVDAIRERQTRDRVPVPAEDAGPNIAEHHTVDETYETFDAEYPDEDNPVPAASGADDVDTEEPVVDDGFEGEAKPDATTVTVAAPDTLDEVHVGSSVDADSTMDVRYVGAEDAHEPDDTSR